MPLTCSSNPLSSSRYVQYGRITVKLDAYALGKVFLELLTGRTHAEDLTTLAKRGLAAGAERTLEQQFQDMLDPKMGSLTDAEEEGARRLAEISIEMTALDEAERLTVTNALPRLQALV
jgi:hypothetical protein